MVTDASSPTRHSQPWYRMVALILLIPIVLPGILLVLLILALLGLYAGVANCVFEYRVRSRMRRRGRHLRLHDVRQRIGADGGTLIIEHPSLGWNFTHAWWTPDDVLARSPYSVASADDYKNTLKEMKSPDWDKWCYNHYTCLEHGRAFLLRVWNGASMEQELKRWSPDLRVVRIWTALAHAQEPPDEPDAGAP